MTAAPTARLVIVDDEQHICDIIQETLADEKYDVRTYSSPQEALLYLRNHPVDLILTDLMMTEHSGVDILHAAKTYQADSVVILMTAHPTLQTAVAVLKQGAYDFLVKPFKLEVLKATIKRGLAHQRVTRDNLRLKGQVEFLKASGAISIGVEIDKYLTMVLSSAKTELTAAAAALIEVDSRNGEVIRRLHITNDDEYLPIVLDDTRLTGFAGHRVCEQRIISEPAIVDGIQMTQTVISSPIYIHRRLHGVLNLLIFDRFYRINPGQLDILTILTNAAGSAIANNMLYHDLQDSYLQAIRALANAIEARDNYTAGHTDRVIKLAEKVARYMGWNETRISHLIVGCTLHDIGKIGVPDSILNKPDRLTDEEREKMLNHPLVGLKIVRDIELFKPALPYIASHHERFDGTGYPRGLAGENIPIEGRLLAVVDTFDAILSDRPYRKGASIEIALRELAINRGRQFDPKLVDIFFEVLRAGLIDIRELYGRDEDLSSLERCLTPETVRV
ncbi:MAG: response regulator [candidate division Zixibacteria bacterium]|nr:response regulator [candidate division Zixibacteria bacterium]